MSSIIVTYVVTSETEAALRAAERIARDAGALDRTGTDVGYSLPNGVEKRYERHYRVGDYFGGVEVRRGPPGSPSFTMTFRMRENPPNRYWKDILVAIVQAIQSAGAIVRMCP